MSTSPTRSADVPSGKSSRSPRERSCSGTSARKDSQHTPGEAGSGSGWESASGAGVGDQAGRGCSDGGETDDPLARCQQYLAARKQQLDEREEQLHLAKTALEAASRRMMTLSTRRSDYIPLNVGGTHLAASRRTLTLIPESLLGTMFSGDWDDHLVRDDSGRMFLDYDPAMFGLLLNWLRSQDMGGPGAPLGELVVESVKEEQFLVLIDFLQLQRHVPCRFTETFSPTLSSPLLTLAGSSAWRTNAGSQGEYAVAASNHTFFDVDVVLLLEVLRFGSVTSAEPAASTSGRGGRSQRSRSPAGGGSDDDRASDIVLLPNAPMFIGVMARDQLAALDRNRKRSNACCRTCEVRQGQSKKLRSKALWCEGDTLQLTLHAAKHPSRMARSKGASCLTLTNTRTTERVQLEISPSCLGGRDGGPQAVGQTDAPKPIEEQWVAIVGLAGRGDEVRINSAHRKGQKPQQLEVEKATISNNGSIDSANVGAG